MAKTNLLKTQDTTFLDLIGNGKIYRVPPYQRDYSWDEDHWEDLWNDIVELRNATEARHYMGALVVEAKTDREFLIIDGQQRLATLSILALAVINTLKSLPGDAGEKAANQDRAERLRGRFIGEKDPASLVESSKLFLNETDDAFYQDYLVQLREPNNPRGLPKSNQLLWRCFQWFQKRLKEIGGDGPVLAKLLSETVARHLLFIQITVEDELNAYTVFETLNARGLELSSTDLLKNYLFSRVKVAADLSALQRRWKTLLSIVKQERFPDFLRYHLLCDTPKIREQRLFKQVREAVREPQEVFDLMKALEARAELFAALDDTEHEYWQELQDARHYIRELQLFKVRQMTPLLFAAREKLEPADFVRVLKLVSVVSFRYTAISGLNTNELEPVYHKAAKALLTGQAKSPADVFQHLKPIYVADEKFIRDFAVKEIETTGQRKRLAKFILCALESDASGKACDYEADPGTIEHILPENPSAEWDACFKPERQPDFIYRIGNLTLLEANLNRQVENGLLTRKRPIYSRSAYQLTRKLVDSTPEDWTPAALEARQLRLATRAAHLWRADFA